ncbi:peptide/nickel transport system permease protein [Evansella caseinilytica]|uniref:Peptide/nickel transport system permease protein n=1 Tax=Evansella caseinilytica TaxID=1503961 RepID=A0A1H3UXR2_9BACI|nr:oligopeptide ABC transporter permease [Evansella caseinilytica]SDZ67224.1 peptide/nickel transport system permease protein [Evansella caseinilytica]
MSATVENRRSEEMIKKAKKQSPWAIARRKLFSNKLAMISLGFLVLVTILAYLAPVIAPFDPYRVDIMNRNASPSADHWLGTDNSGRDILSLLIYGGRTSLTIGFICMFAVVIIGTTIGSIAGFYGGLVDSLLMRFTDFVMNFPYLVFVIVLASIFREAGIWALILVISSLGWTGAARVVRSKTMSEKENEYVMAAISIGGTPFKVIRKHLLPNVMTTIIVQATLLLAVMIVAETALSFLGFGVPAGTPSWGNMMSEARQPHVIRTMWWVWVPPAMAITLTILAINFIGEGIKDAFNPKSTR